MSKTVIEIKTPVNPNEVNITEADVIDVLVKHAYKRLGSVEIMQSILYGYGQLFYLEVKSTRAEKVVEEFRKLGIDARIVS